MSGADLFVDGFPHGTPEGYSQGCKSGACPGKDEFGMSCRMAWTAERSDRRYRRLADDGMPPAGIAIELGMVEPEQLSSSAAASLAAWRVASITPTAEQAAEGLRALAKGGAPLDAVVADLSRPARIRAWALEQGLQVSAVGPIRRAVIEAYDAAEAAPVAADPPAAPVPEPEPERAVTGGAAVAVPVAAAPYCSKHAPNGSHTPCAACGRARRAAASPTNVPEHAEHRGSADEPKQPPVVVGLPNPASVGTISVEAVQEVPELTVSAAPARPDFGQAMADVDVERARRIAVRLEQELAEVERQRDEALADVHTLTTALAREQRFAASAEAEASALRRSIADARARRGRGLGGLVRRMVTR